MREETEPEPQKTNGTRKGKRNYHFMLTKPKNIWFPVLKSSERVADGADMNRGAINACLRIGWNDKGQGFPWPYLFSAYNH